MREGEKEREGERDREQRKRQHKKLEACPPKMSTSIPTSFQVRFLPGTHYLATAGRDHKLLGLKWQPTVIKISFKESFKHGLICLLEIKYIKALISTRL